MKTTSLIVMLLAAAFANRLFAQRAGDLDSTFGVNGVVITSFNTIISQARSVVIQADGKIIAVGGSSSGGFALSRYNLNGTLDSTFGNNGLVTTLSDSGGIDAYSAVIQPDGKIIAGGYWFPGELSGVALVRYNSDGSLDTGFGMGGISVTNKIYDPLLSGTERSIALQSNGKIVVAGRVYNVSTNFVWTLFRYNTDGTIDSSFGSNGKLTTSIGSAAIAASVNIQEDDKIVSSGWTLDTFSNFALTRYNIDGSLDSNFGTDGIVTTSFGDTMNPVAHSSVIQHDGKIIVAGGVNKTNFDSDFGIARYKADGSLDTSFGSNALVVTSIDSNDVAKSVAIQPDGKIIAVGVSRSAPYNFALVRYNIDGSLDNDFGTNGKMTAAIASGNNVPNAVAIQPDGKIVVVGYSNNGINENFVLARYLSGLNVGILTFSPAENVLLYPNPIHNNEVLEYSLQQDEVLSIGLYDISGKLVKQLISQESRTQGAHKEALHFDKSLPAGSYLLTITNGKGSQSIKVMKQ